MTDPANRDGLRNRGTGPATRRPGSVGPHDVKKARTDPANPGLDRDKEYSGQPGDK